MRVGGGSTGEMGGEPRGVSAGESVPGECGAEGEPVEAGRLWVWCRRVPRSLSSDGRNPGEVARDKGQLLYCSSCNPGRQMRGGEGLGDTSSSGQGLRPGRTGEQNLRVESQCLGLRLFLGGN